MKPVRFKNRALKESDLTGSCLQFLELRGVFAWRNNSGARKIGSTFVRWGQPGSPDIIGIMPGTGRFIGVETKKPKGKEYAGVHELDPEQREFRYQAQQRFAIYIIARSLEELQEKYEEAVY